MQGAGRGVGDDSGLAQIVEMVAPVLHGEAGDIVARTGGIGRCRRGGDRDPKGRADQSAPGECHVACLSAAVIHGRLCFRRGRQGQPRGARPDEHVTDCEVTDSDPGPVPSALRPGRKSGIP